MLEINKLKLKGNNATIFNLPEEINEGLGVLNTTEKVSEIPLITYVMTIMDIDIVYDKLCEYSDDLDQVFWILYPKGTSKKYKGQVEVNRDILKDCFNNLGIGPVMQVSLSEDISAMRFRFEKYVVRKNK